jgi:hypothetical protein
MVYRTLPTWPPPDGYVLAVNINRRQLKASARHLIAEMVRRLILLCHKRNLVAGGRGVD